MRRRRDLDETLTGHGGVFNSGPHGGGGSLEFAQDDLVLAHQHGAQVGKGVALCRECGNLFTNSSVKRTKVPNADTWPEALGNKPRRILDHVIHADTGDGSEKVGKTLRN